MACYLGAEHPLLGVIIHSGLLSAARVLKPSIQRSPWFDVLTNIQTIASCKSPVFVIHGTADQQIPFLHGHTLYETAPVTVSPWWVPFGGHNNIAVRRSTGYKARVNSAIRKFRELQQESKKHDSSSVITAQPKPADLAASMGSMRIDETTLAESPQQGLLEKPKTSI
jgi:hypothetical protein